GLVGRRSSQTDGSAVDPDPPASAGNLSSWRAFRSGPLTGRAFFRMMPWRGRFPRLPIGRWHTSPDVRRRGALLQLGRLMKRTAFGGSLVLAFSAAFLIGCSNTDRPKLGRVSGKVTYHGQPVSKGIVSFVPRGGPGAQTGQGATGEIGED